MSRQAYLRDRGRPRSYSVSDPRPLDADRLNQPDQMGTMVERFVSEQVVRRYDDQPDEDFLDEERLAIEDEYEAVPLSDYQLAELAEDMRAYERAQAVPLDEPLEAPEASTPSPSPAVEGPSEGS